MGGASPYRAARFIGGQPGRDDEDTGSGEGSEKYFGLVNVKNTCYVNSVLQALYFCTPFRRRAIRSLEDEEDDPSGESLLTSLAELFVQIEGQKKKVGCLTPRRFLARLRKANDLFCNSEHQDAHEFLQFLLNEIVDNAKKRVKRQREKERKEALPGQQTPALPSGPSTAASSRGDAAGAGSTAGTEDPAEEDLRTWVHDILQGYLVNQMKCLCCENVTVRRETFFDLSVDIEQHTSIAACLRAFESTERLRAGNKFFCDSCGCLQEAEKRLRIYQLPSVLTLHLKRFKYVERLGRCCRLPYRVVFPLQLRVVEHRPQPRRSTGGGETQGTPTDGGAVDGDEANAQPPSRLYELRSVVVHIGRDSSYGHYVTVVRNNDRCVLLDDDVVRVVEPEILRSFYGSAGGAGSGGGDRRTSGSGGGWGSADGDVRGGDRLGGAGPAAPYYERAPEGTCCGYLLLYEAVDRPQEHDRDRGPPAAADLGQVVEWTSEDRNFSGSESGESAEERSGAVASRHHPNACDDGELTQAFEQRCIPGGPGNRRPASAGSPAARAGAGSPPPAVSPSGATAPPAALGTGPSPGSGADSRGWERSAGGYGGAFAWAPAEGEGGSRTPPTSGIAHNAQGARPLGSVVPAAGAGDAVSLSRVNVVTVPSPTGSGVGGLAARDALAPAGAEAPPPQQPVQALRHAGADGRGGRTAAG